MELKTPLFFLRPNNSDFYLHTEIFNTLSLCNEVADYEQRVRDRKVKILLEEDLQPLFRSLHLIQQCPNKPEDVPRDPEKILFFLKNEVGIVITQRTACELLHYVNCTNRKLYKMMGLKRALIEIDKYREPITIPPKYFLDL